MNGFHEQLSLFCLVITLMLLIDLFEHSLKSLVYNVVCIFEEDYEVIIEELLGQVRMKVLISLLVEISTISSGSQR